MTWYEDSVAALLLRLLPEQRDQAIGLDQQPDFRSQNEADGRQREKEECVKKNHAGWQRCPEGARHNTVQGEVDGPAISAR